MKLYVKVWCPWCIEAINWLKAKGYEFHLIDVLADHDAFAQMRKISGQSLTPTLELENGEVLADFDVGQLEKFLRSRSIQP
ncbi:MAG: glutaredoxin family protein [Chthoniobacterales bacterium]